MQRTSWGIVSGGWGMEDSGRFCCARVRWRELTLILSRPVCLTVSPSYRLIADAVPLLPEYGLPDIAGSFDHQRRRI